MQKRSGLVLDVRQGEMLNIGGVVCVEVLHKSGQSARLRITAPPDVSVRLNRDGQKGDPATGHEMWEQV